MYTSHLSVALLCRTKSLELIAFCVLRISAMVVGSEVPFVGRREEKPGSSVFDSRFLRRSMLLRVIAPCKVMIISEMLLFIKWAWIF